MTYSTIIWIILLLASPFLVRFAAWRAARQPYPIDLAAEQLVVAGADRKWIRDAEPLKADMFADAELGARWQEYLDGADIRQTPMPKQAWVQAGSKVITAADDRNLLSGRGMVGVNDEGLPMRMPSATSVWRYLFGALMIAAPAWAAHLLNLPANVSAMVALMSACGLIIAMVDWDTLYVDLPTTAIATAAALSALLMAGPVGGWQTMTVSAVLVGGLLALVVLYKLLRGFWGMAGGDFLLMPAFLVAPAGITGAAALPAWAIMVACVTALGGYWIAHRKGADVPFAFGPYLIMGWPIAALIWQAIV